MPLILTNDIVLQLQNHTYSIASTFALKTTIIGVSLSEPHIDWHNGPRGGECIYLSRGSVCPFQCSQELGNALFSTCAHYNWRLVSNKIPGILAIMHRLKDDNNRDQRHLKSNNLYTTRPLPESDDERQSHPINVKADDWSDKRNIKGPTGDTGGKQ